MSVTPPDSTNTAPLSTSVRPAARLAGLEPYRPPIRGEDVDALLDLNEGLPQPDLLPSTLPDLGAEHLRRYPNAGALEAQIASAFDIDPDRVVVTNGGDDAIDRACRCVIEPGSRAVLHTPTFEMIPRGIALAGGRATALPWFDGEFPRDRFLRAIDADTSMAALVSPNNPTGAVVPTDAVLEIAARAREVNALSLVDLAYIEFADEDPTHELMRLDTAVLVRTFSKAFGLAGLRVGYAIAPAPIAAWLRTVGSPFPVSSLSLAIAAKAWADRESRSGFIEAVREERARLTTLLSTQGLAPLETHANFVTARFDAPARIATALRAERIAVRRFQGRPDLEGCLRISLPGEPDAFARLTAALHSALRRSEP